MSREGEVIVNEWFTDPDQELTLGLIEDFFTYFLTTNPQARALYRNLIQRVTLTPQEIDDYQEVYRSHLEPVFLKFIGTASDYSAMRNLLWVIDTDINTILLITKRGTSFDAQIIQNPVLSESRELFDWLRHDNNMGNRTVPIIYTSITELRWPAPPEIRGPPLTPLGYLLYPLSRYFYS
jgi:hypothetical protein